MKLRTLILAAWIGLCLCLAHAQTPPALPATNAVALATNTSPVFIKTNVIVFAAFDYPPCGNLPEAHVLLRTFDGTNWQFVRPFIGDRTNVFYDRITTNATCWYTALIMRPDCTASVMLNTNATSVNATN